MAKNRKPLLAPKAAPVQAAAANDLPKEGVIHQSQSSQEMSAKIEEIMRRFHKAGPKATPAHAGKIVDEVVNEIVVEVVIEVTRNQFTPSANARLPPLCLLSHWTPG